MGKRILNFIISIILVFAMLPDVGWADAATPGSFKCSNEFFDVELEDGYLDVTVKGDWEGELPWADYRENVVEATLKGKGVTKLTSLFEGCVNLERVKIANLDTSKVTNFNRMFYGCSKLEKIDFREWNLASAQSFDQMFAQCKSLSVVNMAGWSLGNSSISLKGMFTKCSSLKNLDLSSWKNTKSISNLDSTFRGCEELEKLNLAGWDWSGVRSAQNTFENDARLVTSFTVAGNIDNTDFCLSDAATAEGSKVRVRYAQDAYKAVAEKLWATAEEESNVELWKIPVIGDDAVSLSSDRMIYDGKEQKPEITVKVNNTKLVEGLDYTLDYSNNINPSENATVKVTGREDYTGTVEKKFSVVREINKIEVSSDMIQKVSSNKAMSFTFSSRCKHGKAKVKSDNKKVSVAIDSKGIVTVKVAANYMGNVNLTLVSQAGEKYDGDTKIVKLVVGPKGTTVSSVKSSLAGQFVVSWKQNSKVTGYQVRYSDAIKMDNAVTFNISKNSTVQKTVSGLKAGKEYYVQVRTYKTVNKQKIYSQWTKIQSVKITSLAISQSKITMYKGDSRSLKINGTKQSPKWTSSNKGVASVDKKGRVKAIKPGTAIITASLGKMRFTCKVTVKNKSAYQQLYDYIVLHGKSNKEGNLVIKKGNYGVIYNFKNTTFDFIYVNSGKKKDSVTFSIGRNGSKSTQIVYAYSDGYNFCKATASFKPSQYKKGKNINFKPEVYRGYDVARYKQMANNTLSGAMQQWSGLVKKAGTSMKGIGFKAYK